MKLKALLVCLVLYKLCIAQIPDLTNWKLDSLPVSEKIHYEINMAGVNWRFLKSGDKWEIVKHHFDYIKGDSLPFTNASLEKNLNINPWYRSVKKIPGGYLVGVWLYGSHGLYYISDDGLTGYKMQGSFAWIGQVFEYNGKYYALNFDFQAPFGEILEIFKKDSIWKYRKIAETTPSAMIVTTYKNGIIGLTRNSIFKFGKDLKPKEVLKAPFFWGTFNPFSMLFNNDDLYIAMKGGVLKIKSFDTKPSYEWYVPK